MTVQGHVKNGVIVPDQPIKLPEGAAVQIELLKDPSSEQDADGKEIPTLYERLKPFIGVLEGLPPDAAMNYKHYLYGHPKNE